MKINYHEFMAFKDEYLRDPDPIHRFGKAFCIIFGVSSERISRTATVVEARIAIEAEVEWTSEEV